jgi:hypothetical protein
MSFLTGLSITAIIAAIAAFFNQVKQFFRHVSGLVLFQKKVTGGMCTPVGMYIRNKMTKLPSGISSYLAIYGNIGDSSRNSYIPFELPATSGLWRSEHGTFLINVNGSSISIISLRWISRPQELIKAALRFQNDLTAQAEDGMGNYYVSQIMGSAGDTMADYRDGNTARRKSTNTLLEDAPSPVGGSDSDQAWGGIDTRVDKSFMYEPHEYIKNRQGKDPLRGLFFDQPVHDLIDALQRWFKQREWYEERGIPWRTGAMFQGPGGTGKSSLAKAIAQKLGIPLQQFYLNTLTDREFMDNWDRMPTPCVVALEDFDTVFHGREPVTVHKSLSFECVLNKISGISSLNGVCLIVTTNHIEHIDPALGQIGENGRPTRPGRIDHILELRFASPKVQADIAEYVLGGWAPDLVSKALEQGGEGFTAAQFQSMCIQMALERKNEES